MQIGVIVQIGVQMRPAILVRRQQPAVDIQRAAHEIQSRGTPSRSNRRVRTRDRRAPCRGSSSAFQEVRIFSSRPGRTRFSRAAKSFSARARQQAFGRGDLDAEIGCDLLERLATYRCQCEPSKLAS